MLFNACVYIIFQLGDMMWIRSKILQMIKALNEAYLFMKIRRLTVHNDGVILGVGWGNETLALT